MHDLIDRLRSTPNLSVIEMANTWELHISKTEGLTFVIVIPHNVLEWFATARNSRGKVWSDWADYYPINNETTETLRADMASDIESFVIALSTSSIRVTEKKALFKTKHCVDWKLNGNWQKISLSVV